MAGHAGFRDVRSHVPDRQFGSDDWGEDHGHSLPTERKQLLLPRSRKERRGGPEEHSRISTKGNLDQWQHHVHDAQDDSARVGSSETTRTASCSSCSGCLAGCLADSLASQAASQTAYIASLAAFNTAQAAYVAEIYAIQQAQQQQMLQYMQDFAAAQSQGLPPPPMPPPMTLPQPPQPPQQPPEDDFNLDDIDFT